MKKSLYYNFYFNVIFVQPTRCTMKKITLAILIIISGFSVNAQTPFANDSRVITTGLPFVLIASDARAAGMGDMGVATPVDSYSQHWNSSKYVFSEAQGGVGISYTPYLSKLVDDIFLGSLTGYARLNEQSAVAASFRYFSLGEIEFVDDKDQNPLIQKPNEFSFDVSYGLRLSETYGMAVAMRYMRSDLKLNTSNVDKNAASTFGVDITGFYQGEEKAFSGFDGRWRGGFAIQHLGPKFKYDEASQENFQPTTLRLGGGFDFVFDEYNKLGVTAEFAKLLVPTPPKYGYIDELNDGYTPGRDEIVVLEGKDPDVGFMKGIFQSFGDAPGGGKEELQEVTMALGLEYLYQDSFAFRAGFFNEHETKGARKFASLGAGFKYNVINMDLSYLFSTSKTQSPLEGTLRFSLSFNLGEDMYSEN